MALGFDRFQPSIVTGLLADSPFVTEDDKSRLANINTARNFYEGYHWQGVPELEGVQLTFNFCRAFVNKFSAFELGQAFTIRTHESLEGIPITITPDNRTTFEFLEDVWEDNSQYAFCTRLGIEKSLTGDAWIEVSFQMPEDAKNPFGMYDDGRIIITLYPAEQIFVTFNEHSGELEQLAIVYEYETDINANYNIGRGQNLKTRLFTKVWTKETVSVDYGDGSAPTIEANPYQTIPFAHIPNLPLSNSNLGYGDLVDVIPLNIEYNIKASNISDIIDYHAAPTTIVYGAKIGQLEKGANRMWGNLPKDARIENLEMSTDLASSNTYLQTVKNAMNLVTGVPAFALGEPSAFSNTSGVAFQYINMPLIERVNFKKLNTEDGLEHVNRLILLIAETHGIITVPSNVTRRDFFWNAVELTSTLPKDMLMELQQIQVELQLGLESVAGAMERLGKENTESLIQDIEADKKRQAEQTAQLQSLLTPNMPEINSGMTNGTTPVEQVRREIMNKNG